MSPKSFYRYGSKQEKYILKSQSATTKTLLKKHVQFIFYYSDMSCTTHFQWTIYRLTPKLLENQSLGLYHLSVCDIVTSHGRRWRTKQRQQMFKKIKTLMRIKFHLLTKIFTSINSVENSIVWKTCCWQVYCNVLEGDQPKKTQVIFTKQYIMWRSMLCQMRKT